MRGCITLHSFSVQILSFFNKVKVQVVWWLAASLNKPLQAVFSSLLFSSLLILLFSVTQDFSQTPYLIFISLPFKLLTMQTRTVQVKKVSDLASEREIHEFFSFSGEIEHIEIQREHGQSKTAFVTFKDPKALEIALLLSGATIVDQIVSISPVENYVPNHEMQEARMVENAVCVAPEPVSPNSEDRNSPRINGRVYVSKAQDAVANMLAKGSAIRQDAVNKAKAFDEKHQLRASASAKVISFDRKVGLTEKLTVGISVVNEKVKSVDQRLQVSDKTMAALFAAERKINNTGSAVKTSRYVTAGAAWLNGAFSKVAKAGQVAGTKTREKFHMAVSNLTTKDPIAA
ncbi:binding partner of ACD11 1 isoform X2 [Humulus lupulus]|uniref:binding partner of ACD11 1 isoform X2 n=1 Tax=Humulus lupulus TaxID=3486 RepID=UPI002B409E12|nr:binding partner of ACD11 1 isoform X2 [Humulus lupulus]